MREMSNRRLFAQIVGAIVIACLIPVLALTLVYSIVPEIYPATKFYLGLVGLIGISFAVVLGYARYQQWLSSKESDGNRKPDSLQSGTKHRAF